MIKALLNRLETGNQGTFGRLAVPGLTIFTGELPDHGNQPNISCISEGTYRGEWTYSPHLKRWAYLIFPVAGRTGLRIHSANFMGEAPPYHKQLNGCIAPGEKIGWMDGQKAVLLSRPAVRRFETLMRKMPFILEVHNAYS